MIDYGSQCTIINARKVFIHIKVELFPIHH